MSGDPRWSGVRPFKSPFPGAKLGKCPANHDCHLHDLTHCSGPSMEARISNTGLEAACSQKKFVPQRPFLKRPISFSRRHRCAVCSATMRAYSPSKHYSKPLVSCIYARSRKDGTWELSWNLMQSQAGRLPGSIGFQTEYQWLTMRSPVSICGLG